MYYVTDTHSFIWYLIDSPELSLKARKIFDACEKGKAIIIIPAIVRPKKEVSRNNINR
jgi:PIN domain nuclease of toxin-antitoxin system